MRYGFWMPVFGGWLRNVPDEGMEASWAYAKALTQDAERWGYDLTLIAELNLNDIKGTDQPALDAWSTAAALAAVTERLELMVAVRPNFHHPALFAKAAANIDRIAGGRLSLNVVSSWWADEARQYGLQFDQHDDRYARTAEWLSVVDGLWTQDRFSFAGQFYTTDAAICAPKPVKRPTIYAGGESEAAKAMIAARCDAYVMHGDPVAAMAPKIADMAARRRAAGGPPMHYGMAAYAIVRDSEAEAKRELERITTVTDLPAGYANFDQWLSGTQLERELKIQEYSVSNRGLRPNLVGTPEQLKERIAEYEAAGLDLLLLQMSPQAEEMERFAAQVMGTTAVPDVATA
ncbi:alkanesulfonate monooxygenase [Sphingomonas melonis TY]|jgi:dimethylsulfone monooxygenase|uniref:Alkanesulfonate monooxygenase n=1 Tax=Sphingomonas melonis TY TaxID=621456 RepID=A0A154NCJ2_9SPHN|nr:MULTISPECIES: LLM class flavin-dependent oxidoreductase [Sphingomonas]AOW23814.1 alkanesulfonate monooxygenase [Sphingomonas melonis TY]ATI54823.1 LLM class flavin-dependent oxidoreductase [Sphingomonas melonis]KZB96793.1 alkanesulfonate monooxygenase [Sphingomonas melonis TY]MBX8846116.1 LLM class flavin-dependent oxidoreductase [Sphingomonas melonis]MBX8855305.1 LLM class flavin-dependent oxidoreductase [Sphingomonas melonis]